MREHAIDYLRTLVPIKEYLASEGIEYDYFGGETLDPTGGTVMKLTDENYKLNFEDHSFLTLSSKRFYEILSTVRKNYEYDFFK